MARYPEDKLGIERLKTERKLGKEVTSTNEAARVLNVSRVTIWNWMNSGYLDSHQVGKIRKPLALAVRGLLRRTR